MAGTSINVNVTGATRAGAHHDGRGNGNGGDHGDWANAQLSCSTETTAVFYLSDRTWTSMTNGWGPVEKDRSNGEAGATDGGTITLNGVTYAKGLGAHAGSDIRYALNGTCSVLTAVVGIDDEVDTWGTAVFQVWTDGVKKYDSGLMVGAMAGTSINVDVTGATELALIMTDGGDGNGGDHGDWANAQVTCTVDTTAPTVTATSPVTNAIGVAVGANVTATFSEAMTASTLTTTTVTLVPQGSTTPVAATVTYAAATNTVTLDPTSNLVSNTGYTATIKGGASGAKDVGGTAMSADKVWSFTTNAPPVATISQPLSTFKFSVGDVITYAGSATDDEDGALTGTSLSWSIVIFHCPGGTCHEHPFTNGSGTTGTFTAPDHGDDSYFEITLSATDSGGLVGTTSVTIQPETVQLTLATSPAGLQVVYGGITATSPATFTTIVGATHTIQAPSPQGA